jgi:Asp-tRNA(Asn)/Glu-tRNA(Gln) amidotransferase A subunit family amidase
VVQPPQPQPGSVLDRWEPIPPGPSESLLATAGIVGFKPTYGRVSNRGVAPLSWALDHVGPLCRTVEDAALVLGVIAGYDELDPSTVDTPVPDYGSLPIGIQIVGAPFAESTVLALEHAYERETEWHKRHPKINPA